MAVCLLRVHRPGIVSRPAITVSDHISECVGNLANIRVETGWIFILFFVCGWRSKVIENWRCVCFINAELLPVLL